MKRILSFLLVLTCLFSSFAFLASAEESTEHVHERNPYMVCYTETTHEYRCSICRENYVEDHTPDEEGKCPCGYMDHEHSPEAWYMSNGTSDNHMFLCSKCSIFAIIFEEHTFDEKGICWCGMYDLEKVVENLDFISVFRAIFKMIPQLIDFMTKAFRKTFEVAFEMVN